MVKWIVDRNCLQQTFLSAWELSRRAGRGKVSCNVLLLLSKGFIWITGSSLTLQVSAGFYENVCLPWHKSPGSAEVWNWESKDEQKSCCLEGSAQVRGLVLCACKGIWCWGPLQKKAPDLSPRCDIPGPLQWDFLITHGVSLKAGV